MSGLDDIFGPVSGQASPSSLDDIFGPVGALGDEARRKAEARRIREQEHARLAATGELPTSSADTLGADPGAVVPAARQAANMVAGPLVGALEFAGKHPVIASVLSPAAAVIGHHVTPGTNAELQQALEDERVAAMAHGHAVAQGVGAAAGLVAGLLVPGGVAAKAGETVAAPLLARAGVETVDALPALSRLAVRGTEALVGSGEGAAQGYLGAEGGDPATQRHGALVGGLLGLGGAAAAGAGGELARVLPEGNVLSRPRSLSGLFNTARSSATLPPVEPTAPITPVTPAQEIVDAANVIERTGRPEVAPALAGVGPNGAPVRPGLDEAVPRPLPAVSTGVGDTVPLPAGPVYRGQAVSAEVAGGFPRGASHLWGTHFTESPEYAALHAAKYGDRGTVVASDTIPVERPFSVARDYGYGELQQVDANAALSAAREAGITSADQPVPGGLFHKALVDQALGEQPRTATSLEQAIQTAGQTLQRAGYDAYHHEVTVPGTGGKANSWAVFSQDAPVAHDHVAADGATTVAVQATTPVDSAVTGLPPKPAVVYPPLVTGVKNAITAAERDARGLPQIEMAARADWGPNGLHLLDRAKARVDSHEIDPRTLAVEIAKNPRPLTDDQVAVFDYDRMRLYNDHRAQSDAIDQAVASGDKVAEADARLDFAKTGDAINANDMAVMRGGTESGRGLSARRFMIREDYSAARLEQRQRIATGTAVNDADRLTIKAHAAKIEELTAKLAAHEEAAGARASQDAVKRMQADIAREMRSAQRSAAFAGRREMRGATKVALGVEFDALGEQFRRTMATPRMGLDPAQVKIIVGMARNRVQLGVVDAAQVADHVYLKVREHADGLTLRDVRDAISGYGVTSKPSQDELARNLREVNAHLRLFSAVEDAQRGDRPLRSGPQRDPQSPKTRALVQQLHDEMRKSGIDLKAPLDPETQMRSAVEATRTRLTHAVEDLDRQITTGARRSPRTKVPYDEGMRELAAERDRLRGIRDGLDQAAKSPTELIGEKVAAAEAALQRHVDDLAKRVQAADVGPRAKSTVAPWSPKISELKQRQAKLNDAMETLRDATRPPRDPETLWQQAALTRALKRKAEIDAQLVSGNFAPKAKPAPFTPNAEVAKARIALQQSRDQADLHILKRARDERTLNQRVQEGAVKWVRFMALSNVATAAFKIPANVVARGIGTPATDAVVAALGKLHVLPASVLEQSPRYSHFNLNNELLGLKSFFDVRAWAKDVNAIRQGLNDSVTADVRALNPGTPIGAVELPPSWIDFFGILHAGEKNPAKRAEYVRSFAQRSEHSALNGDDPHDPMVSGVNAIGAFGDANRDIFMGTPEMLDINGAAAAALAHVRQSSAVGEAVTAGLRATQYPITKVANNFVAEVSDYAIGTPKAVLYTMFKGGIKNLGPDGADYVARNVGRNALGMGLLFAMGWFGKDKVQSGGYYVEGEKRDPNDLKPGDLRMFGVDIPHSIQHLAPVQIIHMAATLARVKDQYDAVGKPGGLGAGMRAAGWGLAEQSPFIGETARSLHSLSSAGTASPGTGLGELAKGFILPSTIQRAARVSDQTPDPSVAMQAAQDIGAQDPTAVTKRYPQGFLDDIKMGVPGARQTVPTFKLPPVRFDGNGHNGITVWGDFADDAAAAARVAPLQAELERIGEPLDEYPDPVVYDASNRQRVKLAPNDYSTYITLTGRAFQRNWAEIMGSPDYAGLPLQQQQVARRSAMTAARAYANAAYWNTHSHAR